LDGRDNRLGEAVWFQEPGKLEVARWAAVSFGKVTDGAPVEGTYDVVLPDGSRARGRFRADWWPSKGPGG
jgi:hypothetical protein